MGTGFWRPFKGFCIVGGVVDAVGLRAPVFSFAVTFDYRGRARVVYARLLGICATRMR